MMHAEFNQVTGINGASAIDGTVNVAIIGPGPATEGGITEVIRRVTACFDVRADVQYRWISTHTSGSAIRKIFAALRGMWTAVFTLHRADIAHIHSSAYLSFYRKLLFFVFARAFRVPVVWHLHTPNDDFVAFFGRKSMSGRIARWVMRKCVRVVVLSEAWISIAEEYLPGSRIVSVYNPTPHMAESGQVATGRDRQQILFLGHLIQRKGYPLLVKAFAGLSADYPSSRLVFAGSGEVEQARNMAAELGVSDRVDFLGWVVDPGRSQLLEKSSIFVLPTYQEGLPMGILEAMAYSLAIVTTPVGGIPDIIVDHDNGLLVPPGDAKALEAALRQLLGSPTLATQLGVSARRSVQHLSPSAIADQWVAMYIEIATRQQLVPGRG